LSLVWISKADEETDKTEETTPVAVEEGMLFFTD